VLDDEPAKALERCAPDERRLAFDELGGPIVAVCGLHGGAGTSTLAHLLAAGAAGDSRAPVLLCESDDVAGDIAHLTGATSPLSLAELAAAYAAGRPPVGGTLAHAGALRVIAGAPRLPADVPAGAIADVVQAAADRHGLTVVDVGTLHAHTSRELLQAATHIVWTTIARPGAAASARAQLASDLVPALAAACTLAVRSARRGRVPAVRHAARELRELAELHCDRMLFIAEHHGDSADLDDRRIRATLTELAGALRQRAPGRAR
jgi:MinD-like ATPase involved in chromosome partitioning or flagellar assembly